MLSRSSASLCGDKLQNGFCPTCNSGAGNSFSFDRNPNSFDNSPNFSYLPPQPQYETIICELCGNNAHYGYDCPPQVPFVNNKNPCFDQNFNNNFPLTSPNFQQNYGGPHETFQYQPMNQNFFNASGFDQFQPPQQFDNHQPQENPKNIPFFDNETRNEIYKMMGDFRKRINQQREQEALLVAQREQELQQAAQEKELKQNSQRLDKEKQEVKNIKEPTAKCQTRITPCLKNFKVIHKESIFHLNKTPQISSVNAIAPDLPTSSVENLVPILSESEGISDDACDVPVCKNSSTFDALKDHSEILSESNDDDTSSDDDDFEDIEYVEASSPDSELVSLEESPSSFPIPVVDSDSFFEESDISLPEFETFCDHTEETRSGSTTFHADYSLPEYDSFLF
ncbi:hypothetical protein Tco_0533634 [Tanacetum coccineum]